MKKIDEDRNFQPAPKPKPSGAQELKLVATQAGIAHLSGYSWRHIHRLVKNGELKLGTVQTLAWAREKGKIRGVGKEFSIEDEELFKLPKYSRKWREYFSKPIRKKNEMQSAAIEQPTSHPETLSMYFPHRETIEIITHEKGAPLSIEEQNVPWFKFQNKPHCFIKK